MVKNRWLVRPLEFVAGKFSTAARYLGHPELLPVRLRGVPVIHVLPLMTPWLREMPFATILDIGANTGQFAVSAGSIFPAARLYSFEPLPDCFEKLQQHLAKNPRARAFNVGLGTESGELSFQRSSASVSSSFRPMASSHREAFPHTSGTQEVKVRVARLDDLAGQLEIVEPMLIKIDVQGYEDHVLRGGEATIRRAQVVVIETSFVPLYEGQPLFDDVNAWMRQRGFRVHGALDQIAHPVTGRILQADSIYIRE